MVYQGLYPHQARRARIWARGCDDRHRAGPQIRESILSVCSFGCCYMDPTHFCQQTSDMLSPDAEVQAGHSRLQETAFAGASESASADTDGEHTKDSAKGRVREGASSCNATYASPMLTDARGRPSKWKRRRTLRNGVWRSFVKVYYLKLAYSRSRL